MWEQLPVTDGILRDEITKTKAPDMASRIRVVRFRVSFPREIMPAARTGRHKAPQAMQRAGGRYPSMICMADAAWGTQYAAPSIPQRLTSRFSLQVNGCFIVWIPPDEINSLCRKKYASPDSVRERRTTTKPDLPAAHGDGVSHSNLLSGTTPSPCAAGLRHNCCAPCTRLVRPLRGVCLSGRIRCKAGLPAWAVYFPRLITFPCVPTVAAACPAACKPGPAVTAAVPHRSCTCFPILPAGLAAPDTLQLLCAYQHIIKSSGWQTKNAAEGCKPSRRFYLSDQRNSLPSSAYIPGTQDVALPGRQAVLFLQITHQQCRV